jgi:small nuclear ribonucleoprotein (snRNP)-like protein
MHAVCLQLVELKNGETYNGRLENCDSWMNIHLREVICTSKVRHHMHLLISRHASSVGALHGGAAAYTWLLHA